MLANRAGDLAGAHISSSEFKSAVLLKNGSDWPPLFLAPGLSCEVDDLKRLAGFIGCRRPIYGLQPAGSDGSTKPLERIEEMGQRYFEDICALQPSGPYLLAGHSIGGLITLEIAHRLSSNGKEVAFLGFLDTYPLPKYWPFVCWLKVFLKRAQHHLRVVSALPVREMIPGMIGLAESFLDHLRNRGGLAVRRKWSVGEGASPALEEVRRCTLAAWRAYRPRYYFGTITFLRAAVDTIWPSNPAVIWDPLARKLEIHSIAGDHSSICTVYAEDVAARLSWCLENSVKKVNSTS